MLPEDILHGSAGVMSVEIISYASWFWHNSAQSGGVHPEVLQHPDELQNCVFEDGKHVTLQLAWFRKLLAYFMAFLDCSSKFIMEVLKIADYVDSDHLRLLPATNFDPELLAPDGFGGVLPEILWYLLRRRSRISVFDGNIVFLESLCCYRCYELATNLWQTCWTELSRWIWNRQKLGPNRDKIETKFMAVPKK